MDDNSVLVEIKNIAVKTGGLNNINLTIREHEQWAILGKSGSGKTTLAHALTGKLFYSGEINYSFPSSLNNNGIALIEQQHRFKNLSNTSDFYYQQRFNSSDADNSITVSQALTEYTKEVTGAETVRRWIELLHLTPLLQEPLIQLSNGENKRLQLAEALLSDPALLILDNPFIGLDTEGRKTLHKIIDDITARNIHVILITTPQELPDCITHIGLLENSSLTTFTKSQYYAYINARTAEFNNQVLDKEQLKRISKPEETNFTYAIKMKNVSIQYGEKKILDNINWEVKKGECWSISGANGAGKSTLLSLVTADNPQAYANEIYLFDKPRGKGESIWDIKRKIGYVSPELHLFFEQHNTSFSVIASGLFDTIGLFRQINEEQKEQVETWIKLLQLTPLTLKPLFQLSLGQQRMVLLARALVKNPPLLILDEPCQGLDEEQSEYFKTVIDQLCSHFDTTLLYVSHYEKDIPACVSRYLKLAKGRQVN